jgi:hypothetical protein
VGSSGEGGSGGPNVGDWSSRFFAVGWALLLGAIAVGFNQLLYRQQEPLFDAVSYLERLHRVMSLARRDGLAAGLHEATHYTTVTLPYLLALPFSGWLEPARWIGITIQTAGLAVFLLVFDRLLATGGVIRHGSRMVGQIAIGLMAALQFTNGGLSDFRMDLLLMLGYGATVGSLSVSLRSGKARDWVATGLCAAACALVRATAPVYLILAAGPVLLMHCFFLAEPRRRAAICLGSVVAVLVAAALAGWFYVINAEYLKFYYTVWNTDANARLPWIEALTHIKLCWRQLGWAWLGASTALGSLAWRWRGHLSGSCPDAPLHGDGSRGSLSRGLVLEFIWYALVPVGMLVALRAGLNPFVSMPSAAAIAMASGLLLGHFHQRLSPDRRRIVVMVTVLFVLVAVGKGCSKHARPNHRQMGEHLELVDVMLNDARSRGLDHVRFASLQTCDLQTESLWNCVLFDVPGRRFSGNETFVEGIRLEPDRLFFLPAEADWDAVPGADDEARRIWLVERSQQQIDYLIVPDRDAVLQLEKAVRNDVINRHVGRLSEMLLAGGGWTKIAGFQCSDNGRGYGLWRRDQGATAR